MVDPEEGCSGLKNVFIDHIFHDTKTPWTKTTAIMGVHTLGSAKPENSGYNGTWSDPKN